MIRAVGSVDLNLGHCTGAEEAVARGSHASGRSRARRVAAIVIVLFIALMVIVPTAQSTFMITVFAVTVADQHRRCPRGLEGTQGCFALSLELASAVHGAPRWNADHGDQRC